MASCVNCIAPATHNCGYCKLDRCEPCSLNYHTTRPRGNKHPISLLGEEIIRANINKYIETQKCTANNCDNMAQIYCGYCRVNYCQGCSKNVHAVGRKQKHPRKLLNNEEEVKSITENAERQFQKSSIETARKNIIDGCNLCKKGLPTVYCHYCKVNYCINCSNDLHAVGRKRKHPRVPIDTDKVNNYKLYQSDAKLRECGCGNTADSFCQNCQCVRCNECSSTYHSHARKNKHRVVELTDEEKEQYNRYKKQCESV